MKQGEFFGPRPDPNASATTSSPSPKSIVWSAGARASRLGSRNSVMVLLA